MKSLGIVTGLASEAACLGKVQFCRVAGADAVRAGLAARALIAEGCLGLLSFGLAGGLDPNLEPGAVIVAAPRHAPSPAQIGAVNGIIMQGSNVGQLAGPPILAAVVTWSGGWDNSGWLLLLIGVIGVGFALGLRFIEARN